MSVDVSPAEIADLEAQFENEIPCGKCAAPAKLRSHGHGCPAGVMYKCIPCWQAWLESVTSHISRRGYTTCTDCEGGPWHSIASFSDYREF